MTDRALAIIDGHLAAASNSDRKLVTIDEHRDALLDIRNAITTPPPTLVATIKAIDRTVVTDALNEVLNGLAADGFVDDTDDAGWAYSPATTTTPAPAGS